MNAKGTLIAQVYTSNAQLPIEDATVVITKGNKENQEIVGYRLTDSSGKTSPIILDAPPLEYSTQPGKEKPFGVYNLKILHAGFFTAVVNNVQVFAENETILPTELIPLPQIMEQNNITEIVNITPQNL